MHHPDEFFISQTLRNGIIAIAYQSYQILVRPRKFMVLSLVKDIKSIRFKTGWPILKDTCVSFDS